jgi:hypothetical protein
MLTHRSWVAGVLVTLAGAGATPLHAQTAPTVSVGAGLQSSYQYVKPDDADGSNQFLLNSARLYVNGSAHKNIKFMFNTEYNGSTNAIGVLDAVAQISTSSKFNVWVGRFLPPSDRSNLYGPYYASHWGVYTDGIQDGYPFLSVGRDNGVMYWGQFGKVKASAGLFDGESTTGRNSEPLFAGRVQVDLWDAEDGYYLNGTYYGDKDLLALGGAVQAHDGDVASTFDVLLEKKLAGGGTVTVESEVAKYDGLGGYDARYADSSGAYVLGAYLFPKMGDQPGQLQVLGKFAKATFEQGITPDYDQTTTELNVNYILNQHNARVMFFFRNTTFSAVKVDSKAVGVGLQIQM